MYNKTSLSKFISLVLRHKPETIGIKLDSQGWADVQELINKMNNHKQSISFTILQEIVAEDNKQRYAFNDNLTKIRANQGHSVNVDLQFTPIEPPDRLYHGTAERFIESIKASGINKGNRQHVHLSQDIKTANMVGTRHGTPAIIVLDTKAMYKDGLKFYLSENHVWLTDYVNPKYFIEIK